MRYHLSFCTNCQIIHPLGHFVLSSPTIFADFHSKVKGLFPDREIAYFFRVRHVQILGPWDFEACFAALVFAVAA